ncbi:MAG: hypothetical protein IT452_08985 [Planctomycetia bacterium]|nr:hypothetical protein [Planctomycetia bacterium]
MPEWLQGAFQGGGAKLTVGVVTLRLLLAVAAGLVIAVFYRKSVGRSAAAAAPFSTALILLAPLVGMTAMVIDDNVARAFSLVGALAIVRFRTDVEDTRDTAFVIFSVVAGMAAGVGNWILCAVGIPLVGIVSLLRAGSGPAADSVPLVVRLGLGTDPKAELEPAMAKHLGAVRLRRAATARQGAAMELTYDVALRAGSDAVALLRDLNAVKGVQHAELGAA